MTPDKKAELRWYAVLRRLMRGPLMRVMPPTEAERRYCDGELRRRFEGMGTTPEEVAELLWLEDELLRQSDADFIRGQELVADISYKDMALAAAEEGDYGPLRGLIAKLDERFIKHVNPPPPEEWPKGKRRPLPKKLARMTPAQREEFFKKLAKQANDQFRLREASKDAKRIRALWHEREGRAVRKRCGRSSNWYAGLIWELDEKKVAKWKKPGDKKKSRA